MPNAVVGLTLVGADEELIQIVERQLADAEEGYRLDPSDVNQRRIMNAWSAVRRARGRAETGESEERRSGRSESST